MSKKIKAKYSIYTSYGSKSKVLSEDVVPTLMGDSFLDRLDKSSDNVSKSKINSVPNGYVPAIILKTEKISVDQIPSSHNRAGAALKLTDLQGVTESLEAVTVQKHYAIVAGQGNTLDVTKVPPELLTIVYEIGDPDDVDQLTVNRKCVVEMLGHNYGVLRSNAAGGLNYSEGGDDLASIEGGIPDKFKRPVHTTAAQNKNAAMIIRYAREKGFNDRQISNFLGMAQGESGLIPKSEYGPSSKTTLARLRKVYRGRVSRLSDKQLLELRDSSVVKFFNYVYHGPVGSKWFNDKLKRSGAGNTIGGYKYRGRGFVQHTGYTNYQRLGKFAGEDYYNNPDLLNNPEHAAKALVAYYSDPQVHRNNKRDFNKIRDTYVATYGGSYSGYGKHHREDVLRRGGFALHWYKKIKSGEWKNYGKSEEVAKDKEEKKASEQSS